MAVRGFLTGRFFIIAALAGCAGADEKVEGPKPVPTAQAPMIVNGTPESDLLDAIKRIPPPELDFGNARCVLWNPKLAVDQAFLIIVEVGDQEVVGRLRVTSKDVPTLVSLFLREGKPIGNEIGGKKGWYAVCRQEKPPVDVVTVKTFQL